MPKIIHKNGEKRQNVYNIAMITDANYIMPTIVALVSLSKNSAKKVLYNVNLFTNNLSNDNINLLKKQKLNNIKLNIKDASYLIEKFQNINQSRHVTYTAMLKFYLPELFPNLDKLLYLDSDIIIQKDLSELFNTDIDDSYAGVVKDTLGALNKQHLKKLGINNEYYFNSGLLLLNLRKMREDNIVNKLIEFRLNTPQKFMDQDAFNAVIGHNVKYLSYKYNFLNYYLTVMNKQELSNLYNEDLTIYKNDKMLYKSCNIIHLGGKEKPWIYNLGFLSKLYKRYYKESIFKNTKLHLKKCENSFFEQLFSVKNSTNTNHKIITILGVKIKIRKISFSVNIPQNLVAVERERERESNPPIC